MKNHSTISLFNNSGYGGSELEFKRVRVAGKATAANAKKQLSKHPSSTKAVITHFMPMVDGMKIVEEIEVEK